MSASTAAPMPPGLHFAMKQAELAPRSSLRLKAAVDDGGGGAGNEQAGDSSSSRGLQGAGSPGGASRREAGLPKPLTFDPRAHPSWLSERRNIARNRDAQSKEPIVEFCCLNRNKRDSYVGAGRISGFISGCTARYTRALGFVLVICTERGYLGDNFLYVLRLSQKWTTGGVGAALAPIAAASLGDMQAIKRVKGQGPGGRGWSKKRRPPKGASLSSGSDPDEAADAAAEEKIPVDFANFWDTKFVVQRESVSEKRWKDPQISADGTTVLAIENNTFQVMTALNVVPKDEIPSNRSYAPVHCALSVEPKYYRRKGQEDYPVERLVPQRICPFSHLSLLGSNDSSLVGLSDGSLLKLNHSRHSRVLPDATDFGTPGVDRLPLYWEQPKLKYGNERRQQEYEQQHEGTWHALCGKEYFERHDSDIVALGCTQTDTLIWSLDAKNLICLWRYSEKNRTGFGSFRPLAAWRLLLKDVVFNFAPMHEMPPDADQYTESADLDVQGANEHFLYPFCMLEEEEFIFPAANNTLFRVNASDFSKKRVPVVGLKKSGQGGVTRGGAAPTMLLSELDGGSSDEMMEGSGGGRPFDADGQGDTEDLQDGFGMPVASRGSRRVTFDVVDPGDLHDHTGQSSSAASDRVPDIHGVRFPDVQLGEFAEEHLYGLKVPLLSKFPGYAKKLRATEGAIMDFAFFGKTAAVLYRVQKGTFAF
ncbi:unnamed protein product [Amoebophrya sp. A25]|nr:unnamed protein product [Amoebophrya sp. A25]|eukprot:GSA25T00026902001.1